MKNTIIILSGILMAMTLFSCAGFQNKQQQGTAVGAGTGAAVGAILGQVIGRDTKGTLIGAGIGAAIGGLSGNQIGQYMDRQEQDLQNTLAASEASSIQREQDVLRATFKGEAFFDYDSSALKPGARVELERVAQILNKYPQTMIEIGGHTDVRGPEKYNQELSEERAKSVEVALLQNNVAAWRIKTVGYGESRPISSDHAKNRRVEILIIPIQKGS